MIGDLYIPSSDRRAVVYRNIHLAAYDSTSIRSMGLWAYGERWAWALEVWRNDSLKPSPGVRVQFDRTGGLAISPATIGATTGSDGRVELRASVQDTGIVEGQLTVTPQTGPQRVIKDIRLRTNADEQLHFGGVVSYGPALRFVGEVLTHRRRACRRRAGAVDADVGHSGHSRRCSIGVTDSNGRFPLTLFPSADGGADRSRARPAAASVAGRREFVFDNLRLDSFESSGLKLAVTYRIPRP